MLVYCVRWASSYLKLRKNIIQRQKSGLNNCFMIWSRPRITVTGWTRECRSRCLISPDMWPRMGTGMISGQRIVTGNGSRGTRRCSIMHCLIGRGMGGILWESEAHCFQFLKKQWSKLDYTAILTYAECGRQYHGWYQRVETINGTYKMVSELLKEELAWVA